MRIGCSFPVVTEPSKFAVFYYSDPPIGNLLPPGFYKVLDGVAAIMSAW